MKTIWKYLYFIIILFSFNTSFARNEGILLTRVNGKTKISVPTDGANSPSVIVNQNGGAIFFATGVAAQNLAKGNQQASELTVQPASNLTTIKYSELSFIQDFSGNRIAAAYPLKNNTTIRVAALHSLQKSEFESQEIAKLKIWGLQNPRTNEIYDIAFISENESSEDIQDIISKLRVSDSSNTEVAVQHLNMVDSFSELILSYSKTSVIATNKDYVFLKNTDSSLIGPASSGAIVYDSVTNLPQSIIVCSSKVMNPNSTAVVRALKLETAKRARLIELSADLIESFKPRNCEPYDARRGGGD